MGQLNGCLIQNPEEREERRRIDDATEGGDYVKGGAIEFEWEETTTLVDSLLLGVD